MGLGGFSTHDASFGFFDSPEIELVAIVFMLIAGMNFGTLFLAVTGRSLRPYLVDPEAGWFFGVTLFSIVLVAAYIGVDGVYPEFLTALRHSAFNVVSIATTTGYASVDYALWPIFAPLWMLLLAAPGLSRTGCGLWRAAGVIRSMGGAVVMPVTLEVLQAQVMSLSKADRSRLLDRLIASLDADPQAEAQWEQLAEQRDGEL